MEASFSASRIKVPELLTSFVRRRAQSSVVPQKLPCFTSASILAPTLALAIAVLGISLFSQTAYAASYINVSSGSGGTISFDSIKPSSVGVSASASDTLTITTNCSAGYKVYVSGQENGDTNLTNSSASSNNTISASSTAVGSAATALSSNTWGITGDSANALANKYVGLPAYANATDAALITVPSANTSGNNTNTIYYGVKVDTTLTPGTYSGDVLYTTLVTEACNNYTVHFDANGGSGSMSDQTIPVGTATPLTANAFSRSGYAFLGWSTDKNATTPTYVDKEKVTDLANFNSSTTLYAIWGFIAGDMQTWTGCPNLATNAIVYLKDTRDENVYPIKKLADGKCWMVQNLRLVGEKKLTSADSNVSSDFDIAASTADPNTTNWCTSIVPICYNKTQVYYNTSEASDITKSSYYGALYNWYTATAGTGKYATSSGDATSSICPKGWRLPTGGPSGEFVALDKAWDGTGTSRDNANTYSTFTGAYGSSSSGSFGLANRIEGSMGGTNLYGFYWSSTANSSIGAYSLYLRGSDTYVSPQGYNGKNSGGSVRCIAEDDYTISYSNTGADSGEASKTSESAYESGSVTMPTVGTMTKSGYEFKGWALTSGASDAAYTAEQTVTISALISAASSAGQTTTPGSTITLYPVWEQAMAQCEKDGNCMQDWSGCAALSKNQYITLVDSRDSNEYVVKKLADGKCWMVQNLRLTNYKLTSADSDVTSDFDLTTASGDVKYSGASGWCATNDATCVDVKAVYYDSSQTSSSSNASYYGALYNWYTATASTGNYYKTSGDATSSICPKGWRLPAGGASGEFVALDKAWGGTGENRSSDTNTYSLFTGDYRVDSNGGFGLAGHISSGSLYSVGSLGRYWSSTAYSSNSAYYLYLNEYNAYVYPRGSVDKYSGFSVRCIAEPPAEDCSETVHPTTTTGCKMKDDNIWIYGNNGNTTTWATSYTCPTGYSSPTKAIFDSLVSAQGSGSQLYSALGLSSYRDFWSTTQNYSNYAYFLYVDSSSASVGSGYETNSRYVLCYKQS